MLKPQNVPVSVKLLPLYLGLAVLFSVPVFQHFQHQRAIAEATTQTSSKIESQPAQATFVPFAAKPVRILIPKISIDLPVVDGNYNKNTSQWSVADHDVNFVTNSAPANNSTGLTILYGHYFAWVLGKTKELLPGDIVYLYGADGSVYEYHLRESQTVKPTDGAIFEQSSLNPQLLLMTCDGQWAQVRRAMYFDLVKATK